MNQTDEKLQEIVDFKTELKVQEEKYASLLAADEPLKKLKEVRLRIRYLREVEEAVNASR